MPTLKDLTPEFLENTSKDEMFSLLLESTRENDWMLKEAVRNREFEASCLNILSEFAPWEQYTKEGKVLGALLEAIDKIQDSREEDP